MTTTEERQAGSVAGGTWTTACRLDRLQPGRGVAALVGGRQVALFRVDGPDGSDGAADGPAHGPVVYAIDNVDPCSGAAVLSRGIVGDRGGEPVVASPIYKQAFSLVTGRCLDEPGQEVDVFAVTLADGWVRVELA